MNSDPLLLLRRGPSPFVTGRVRYADADRRYPSQNARIVLRLGIQPLQGSVLAVMDTAAPWCIFEGELGSTLARSFEPFLFPVALSTRLGVFEGALYRVPVRFEADEGESVEVEATVFVSPDWPGGNFIGYEGLLQRIRFAVDPETNLFYFGRI